MSVLRVLHKATAFPYYLPGMSQPALAVQLALDSAPRRDLGEWAAALDAIVTGQFHSGTAAEPAVIDPAQRTIRQLASLLAHHYRRILRGCGFAVFAEPQFEDTGPQALRLFLPCMPSDHPPAARVVHWLLGAMNQGLDGQPLDDKRQELAPLAKHLAALAPPGLNTIRFLEAAHSRRIPFQRITKTLYQYGWGARARWFDSSFTDATPTVASNLARDKFATASWLRQAGLPVPAHQFVGSDTEALAAAARLGYPVVVKPSNMDGGAGVSAGLVDETEVVAAWHRARKVSSKILVEKHFEGNDYRLQVLNGQVFWAVHRVPGGVVGDGASSIVQLLARVNADPVRGARGSSALLKRIDLDDEAQALLARQGLTPASVPAADQFVRLRRASNVASGGHPVPVLSEAHPDNLDLAVRAARVLRVDLAGVDLLIPDIRRSWLETGAAICEVNAQPQLSPHLPGVILDQLVTQQGRIPVIVILGTPSLEPTGRALADALARAGLVAGLALPEAGFVGQPGSGVRTGHPLRTAAAVLLDPRTQVAVLCLEDPELIRSGLPVDQIDGLMLMGDPAAFVAGERDRLRLNALAGQCTGPVVCATRLQDWGLSAGPQRHEGLHLDPAIEAFTQTACARWRDDAQPGAPVSGES